MFVAENAHSSHATATVLCLTPLTSYWSWPNHAYGALLWRSCTSSTLTSDGTVTSSCASRTGTLSLESLCGKQTATVWGKRHAHTHALKGQSPTVVVRLVVVKTQVKTWLARLAALRGQIRHHVRMHAEIMHLGSYHRASQTHICL